MKEASQEGRTVIFVSHDMHAIRSLCSRGVLLQAGKVKKIGTVEEAINEYANSMETQNGKFPIVGDGITIEGLAVMQRGFDTALLDGTLSFEIKMSFSLPSIIDHLRMGISIRTALGDELVRSYFSDWDISYEELSPGFYEAKLEFPGKLLAAGNYFIMVGAKKVGGGDLLAGHSVERMVSVSNPLGFNTGGAMDPHEARILLDRSWDLKRSR
jgi:lipopolysaccharide transport system ATP-binding protein